MILAGDIGGTKTNLALFKNQKAPRPELLREHSFASADFPGLEQIVEQFVKSAGAPALNAACFGIAGPVVAQRCQTSNLPWVIEASALQRAFNIPQVTLINDLEAMAEGILALEPSELQTLNPGAPAQNAPEQGAVEQGAVIAAGTGLGMALLQPVKGEWIPTPSEGGHMDFSPRHEVEMELLRFLLTRHERVSAERVVSGPGLFAVYEFFAQRPGAQPNPTVAQIIAANTAEAPGHVSSAALSGQCPVCINALNLWVECLGALAGNLGLLALSSGGLFLGGGIAPKILTKLNDGTFLSAFTAKGRLSSVLERMPVHVILNPKTPLLGAARRALRETPA